jgi:dCTP deaminase
MILEPNILYLGRTVEHTETNGYVPMLEGRSSLARLGLYVHVSAGFGDNGFKGYWTLELTVVQPLVLLPNIEICQIYYHSIEGDPGLTYDKGKYQDNNDIQSSRLHMELE